MPDDKKYPSNSLLPNSSLRNGEQKEISTKPSLEEDITQKVIKGKAQIRKKSVGQKLADVFLSKDIHSIVNDAVYNIAVPKLKQTVADIISMALGVQVKITPTQSRENHTDYTSFSRRERPSEPSPSLRSLGNDIVYETEADAREVLADMRDWIRERGYVTVSQMYGLSRIKCDNPNMTAYGWRSLDGLVTIVRSSEGYWLNLPRPEYLRR